MNGYPENHYLLVKSFTGLSVKQFDDVFKEIESKNGTIKIVKTKKIRTYKTISEKPCYLIHPQFSILNDNHDFIYIRSLA